MLDPDNGDTNAKTFRELVVQHRRALIASFAFMFMMIVSNQVEEEIYSKLPNFNFYWTVALWELALFAVISWASSLRHNPEGDSYACMQTKSPMRLFVFMGTAMALSTSLGKLAFRYMNFTVGTVVKCNKVLPTMFISFLYLGKKYPLEEVIAALLMGATAVLFVLGASEVDLDFSFLGLVCSAGHMMFQSLQANFQDEALRIHGSSVDECMLWANAVGFLVVLVIVVVSGEIVDSTDYFVQRPWAMLLLVTRSITFYLGARAYTWIIKEAGAVAAVAVGTLRKIFTIALSFIVFPKEYSDKYPVGAVLLVFAFWLEMRSRLKRTET